MTRRRKKRALVPTLYLDWSPAIADLFRLIPDGWRPPARVRLSQGRVHITLSARFVTHDGSICTGRLRLEREAPGSDALAVVEQGFSRSFRSVPNP